MMLPISRLPHGLRWIRRGLGLLLIKIGTVSFLEGEENGAGRLIEGSESGWV